MPLQFPSHEDVVFRKAPLEVVLCQLRFSPVYALLDQAGISGFQEGIRRFYPHSATELDAAVRFSPAKAEIAQSAPVWRFRDFEDDWSWQVSLAVDFVSIETPAYPQFDQFMERLDFILAALERTVKPGRALRIGLRKVNRFSHPDVSAYQDWSDLLHEGLLGLSEFDELPGALTRSRAEFNLDDGASGNLTVRHQIAPDSPAEYIFDLDYWTDQRRYEIRGGSDMAGLLRGYSNSMTAMFHWMLKEPMFNYLDPVPRENMVDRV